MLALLDGFPHDCDWPQSSSSAEACGCRTGTALQGGEKEDAGGPVLHFPTDGLILRLPFEVLYVYPI